MNRINKNNLLIRYAIGATVLLSAGAVYADDDAWLQCADLSYNNARLACYDRVAATVRPLPQPDAAESRLPEENTDAYTPLSLLYDLDKNHESGILSIREHYPMYLLPAWYNHHINTKPYSPLHGTTDLSGQNRKHMEAKMQVSVKTKLWQDIFASRADLWFGYTQLSHWQVYNRSQSAPFRGTDYQPELFITLPVSLRLPAGGKLRMVGGGVLHQSNGQTEPLSRSWNRVYGMAGLEWGKLTVIPRLWWRVPERADDDDNPDINRYMGYGDLTVQYRFDNQQSVGAQFRYNPKSKKGGIRADYTFPIAGRLKGYVQGFYGYGENLQDYNHANHSIGVGLMFDNWDGF